MWIFKINQHTSILSKLVIHFSVCACFLGISMGIGHAKKKEATTLLIDVIETPARKVKTPKIDPKLFKLKDSLVKSFPRFNHFTHLKKHKFHLIRKSKKTLKITSDLKVSLTPLSNRKNQLIFKMEVPQKKASFKLKAQKGKLFYQAMRWKNKVYILAFKTK